MMRTLFETGSRVGTFVGTGAEDLSLADLKIWVVGEGDKSGNVPILSSLRANCVCAWASETECSKGYSRKLKGL